MSMVHVRTNQSLWYFSLYDIQEAALANYDKCSILVLVPLSFIFF